MTVLAFWESKACTSAGKVTEMTKTIAKAICIVAVRRGGSDRQEEVDGGEERLFCFIDKFFIDIGN
jgi:hypothetical protein